MLLLLALELMLRVSLVHELAVIGVLLSSSPSKTGLEGVTICCCFMFGIVVRNIPSAFAMVAMDGIVDDETEERGFRIAGGLISQALMALEECFFTK